MKLSIWDILSVIMLFSTLCLCGLFGVLLVDQSNAFNPFPPPTLRPTLAIIIPTATVTPRLRSMPPTWTPTPNDQPEAGKPTLRPSSTPMPTFTSFVIPSFTASPTETSTPTNTPTATQTATVTPIPTATPPPTFTVAPPP